MCLYPVYIYGENEDILYKLQKPKCNARVQLYITKFTNDQINIGKRSLDEWS